MDRLKATDSVSFANRDIAPVSGTPQYATDGVPGVTPATIWPAYAYNMVMDELMAFLAAASVTPDDTNWGQLLASAKILFGGTGSLGTAGWMMLPGGLIAQWGGFGGTTGSLSGAGVAEIAGISVSFPTTFPNAVYRVFAIADDVSGSELQETAWNSPGGLTTSGASLGLSCRQATTAMTGSYFVIGK